MKENKARMYRFFLITNWSLAEAQEFLIYKNTEIKGYWTQEYKITKNKVIRSEDNKVIVLHKNVKMLNGDHPAT